MTIFKMQIIKFLFRFIWEVSNKTKDLLLFSVQESFLGGLKELYDDGVITRVGCIVGKFLYETISLAEKMTFEN